MESWFLLENTEVWCCRVGNLGEGVGGVGEGGWLGRAEELKNQSLDLEKPKNSIGVYNPLKIQRTPRILRETRFFADRSLLLFVSFFQTYFFDPFYYTIWLNSL